MLKNKTILIFIQNKSKIVREIHLYNLEHRNFDTQSNG